MLGKLLKYELMASARSFIPFYIALVALSLVNMIVFNVIPPMGIDSTTSMYSIFFGLVYFAYYMVSITLTVITFVIIINRFRKALLGKEGYLMFTLPVSIDMHILSKFISAIVWVICSTVIMTATAFLLTVSTEEARLVYKEILQVFANSEFEIAHLTEFFNLTIFQMVMAVLFFSASSTTVALQLIYLSLAIGHLAKKRKFLASVVFFLIISSIANITMQIQFFKIFFNIDFENIGPVTTETAYFFARFMPFAVAYFPFLLFSSCVFTAFTIIFYFTTRYILKNKLNLE